MRRGEAEGKVTAHMVDVDATPTLGNRVFFCGSLENGENSSSIGSMESGIFIFIVTYKSSSNVGRYTFECLGILESTLHPGWLFDRWRVLNYQVC